MRVRHVRLRSELAMVTNGKVKLDEWGYVVWASAAIQANDLLGHPNFQNATLFPDPTRPEDLPAWWDEKKHHKAKDEKHAEPEKPKEPEKPAEPEHHEMSKMDLDTEDTEAGLKTDDQ